MEIEIFTGPNCAHCAALKKFLREHGLVFTERNIADDAVFGEFRERLPRQKSLPQIFIDGEHVGSYEDMRLRMK